MNNANQYDRRDGDERRSNMERREQEEEDLRSPFRKQITGTLLGRYLDENRPRFLLAFLLLISGITIVIFGAIALLNTDQSSFSDGSNSKQLWDTLWSLLPYASGCFTLCQFFAERYRIGFHYLLIFALITFLACMRP